MDSSSDIQKQEQPTQGEHPSVIDAFISALFASSQPTTIAATPAVSDDFGIPTSTEEQKVKIERTLTPRSSTTDLRDSSESTSTVKHLASPASTAVKREISLTEEVEAYTQLSRRRKTIPTLERENGERDSREVADFGDRNHYNQPIDQSRAQAQSQDSKQSSSPPLSSKYHGKAKIITQRLPAQHGQPASTTHMLALKPVNWSKTTAKSRMLIRNIPSTLNNWELLDYFSPYGEIVEIVIKNHIGFIQFIDVSSCQAAVRGENGKTIKGGLLRLEVCKTKPSFARGNDQSRPRVHLIIWDQVPPGYIDHIRFKFEKVSLPIAMSSMRHRADCDEERIIRQKAHPGVIAVLNIEVKHEQQRTVDLRLLKTTGSRIHFDAYDSISLDDAITLVKDKNNANRSISKSPPHQQSYSGISVQATPKEPLPSQHPSLDITALQQLDVNTLAAIYDIAHVQLETALAQNQQNRPLYQQQILYQTQPSYSTSSTVFAHHKLPPMNFAHQIAPSFPASTLSGSPYSNHQYPQSPSQQMTHVKHDSIPLSVEQLGNILSSLNNNNKQ